MRWKRLVLSPVHRAFGREAKGVEYLVECPYDIPPCPFMPPPACLHGAERHDPESKLLFFAANR
jgi:hypothetical protein